MDSVVLDLHNIMKKRKNVILKIRSALDTVTTNVLKLAFISNFNSAGEDPINHCKLNVVYMMYILKLVAEGISILCPFTIYFDI